MSRLEETEITTNYVIIFGLTCIVGFGVGIRFFYFPHDTPVVTDSFISFIYAAKTVFDGELARGYSVANTGWPYILSFLFMFFDKTDPLQLMNIQRIASIIFSSITIIPIFFILRKFTTVKWALFGSFLTVIEPRLLLMSIEGINYSLFLFLFVLSIALFLKKTNFSLLFSFICIACLALVRYEGILLILPFTILYFIKFRNKKAIVRYLFIIFVMCMILIPVVNFRVQATENKCVEYSFGEICGEDGIISHVFAGMNSVNTILSFNEQNSPKEIMESDDPGDLFLKEKYLTGDSNLTQMIKEGFYRLIKYVGYSSVPIFALFILFNFITRLRERNGLNLGFDSKVILFYSGIMLLPALYAYVRGIDELRYTLVLLPLFCILSTSWNKTISKKISKNYIVIILVILVLLASVLFIEMNKRDSIHDRESFLVSKKVVELTDVINRFHQDGYIKTAVLVHDWPTLPNASENGKIIHRFQKVSLNDFEDIREIISESRENNIEYLVVDGRNFLFSDFSDEYDFLIKEFDSSELDYKNRFVIYKIDFQKVNELNS